MASKKATRSVITLTFGDVAENHVRMQKIGRMSDKGFSCSLLQQLHETYGGVLHDLKSLLPVEVRDEAEEASVLVLPGWLRDFDPDHDVLKEQLDLSPDRKCLSRGRVVNKHARHNLCFSHTSQEACYEEGKGTIISYSDVPLLNVLREGIESMVREDESISLNCEGNYYYDTSQCYIGWHGDAERRRVVGLRLGPYSEKNGVPTIEEEESFPLRFRWHHRTAVVGATLTIELKHGDLYFMSEHAAGTLWRSSSLYVPRHSAGTLKEE